MNLSIVIPVFNEEKTLLEILNRINILKAEWAFQTQPAKLQKHAENILMMTNPKENQFIKISEVPLRDSAWKMNRGVSNKQLINTNFAKITFLTN